MKKTLKVVALLLVIVLLVGVFFVIYKLSNNFTTDIKTFYLVLDGKVVTRNLPGTYIWGRSIEVHNVGEIVQGKQRFTYQITRCASAENFTFTVDGEEHYFAERADYTKGFEVEVTADGIILQQQSMKSVLQHFYGKSEVILPKLDVTQSYCTLVITNADGSKSISIDFFLDLMIELDKTHLEF